MMSTAPSRRYDAERQIATGLRTGWIALATFLGIIALSVALMIAFNHAIVVADDMSRDDERQLVQRFLADAIKAKVTSEIGSIIWDEAVSHIQASAGTSAAAGGVATNATSGRPSDSADAWLDREFGIYAWVTYGSPQTFLVRGDGSLVRAWIAGRPQPDGGYMSLRAPIRDLLIRSMQPGQIIGTPAGSQRLRNPQGLIVNWPVDRAGNILPRWAGGLVRTPAGIEMMTAASVVPGTAGTVMTGVPAWLVTMQPLRAGVIEHMRNALFLGDLDLVRPEPIATAPAPTGSRRENAIALTGIDGRVIGAIGWTAKSPGPTILRRAWPMVWVWILLFPGVLIGGSIVLRQSWRTTRELLGSEAQARHNAMHDPMSGLPNRAHTIERLRHDLAACVAGALRGDVFVAYIDLDGFKLVNDTMGHHVGDELVRHVALRLRQSLPASDFIARFGGDEFVILRRGEGGRVLADQLGREVMALLVEPFVFAGHSITVSGSCGISWGPAQSGDPGELLRRADIALYRAKQRGRARYRCFTRGMDASIKLRLDLETELRRAIARDELSVAYQPIVGMAESGETAPILGVEALLRWHHPERGEIRPDMFVPIAEQGGLMIALGNWMLRHVFHECRDWPTCDISVNLSPIQIMASDFVATMAAIVAETGIDPKRVVLEITEGVMLDGSDHVLNVLHEMHRSGFRIALDDFGIGYSSLSYLRMFQFDRIKIDRSFVSNIESDADANAILRMIGTLGRSLRMKVVAEGVETENQRVLVQAAGCDMIQGYLYWKAMSAADIRALLGSGRPIRALRSA